MGLFVVTSLHDDKQPYDTIICVNYKAKYLFIPYLFIYFISNSISLKAIVHKKYLREIPYYRGKVEQKSKNLEKSEICKLLNTAIYV
jgi:hypothetical protein